MLSALHALCVGNRPITGGFPLQRAVMQSSDVLYVASLNNLLTKWSTAKIKSTPIHVRASKRKPGCYNFQLECGTWYHHPRRHKCVLSWNLRIVKVATRHYRWRHHHKNNCIWHNSLCWLSFCSQIWTFNFTTIRRGHQMWRQATFKAESQTLALDNILGISAYTVIIFLGYT